MFLPRRRILMLVFCATVLLCECLLYELRITLNIDACMHSVHVDSWSDSNPFYLHFEFLRGSSIFSSISPKDLPFFSLLSFILAVLFSRAALPPFSKNFLLFFSVGEFFHVRNSFRHSFSPFSPMIRCASDRLVLRSLCSTGGKRKVVEFPRGRGGGRVNSRMETSPQRD